MFKKRIIAGISAFTTAAFALTGCSFFRHDYERDWQQEIARIGSYVIVNPVESEEGEVSYKNYTTPAKTVYKRDLVEYVNNNASSLSQSYSGDPQGMYEYAADMLVNVELVTNEVDALIDCGTIEWGVEQQNYVRKNLYSVIDNTVFSLKNTILDERGQETSEIISGSTEDATTTYPVKPETTEEDDEDDANVVPEKEWAPERSMYPAISGDSDKRSLEREAMRRFVALLKSRVEDDFRLETSERSWLGKKIKNEIKAIDKLINEQGIEYVYPVLGSYSYPMKDSDGEFGYIMYYLSGESIERSQKITSLQEYLTDGVTVNYDEVLSEYTAQLAEQKKQYDADSSAYDTAMSGSTTVLYHPNNNYFYVKHILLPFSDDQKAALTAFANRSDIKNLQADEKKERTDEYRARLAEAIVCYPHKDGEDDLTRPMSVDEVMAHVRSAMSPLASDVKKANDTFNDLIYLYNTDPGAFGNDKGYVVKYKLNDGESETYMQEFADAARVMYETIEPGSVYYQKVITDYGVHIMYMSSVARQGEVALMSATSPDGSQTVYDLLEEPIRTSRENAAYTRWENEVLTYNYDRYAKLYKENFSDLWED